METYSAILTGTPDLALPISRAQIRRAQTTLALEVSVPSTVLADAIAARPSGALALYYGASMLASVPLASVVEYRGSRSGTLVLSGTDTVAPSTPATVDIDGVSYRALDAGKRRVRCAPAHAALVGDTVQWAGESMVVSEIVLSVDSTSATMELAE